MKYCYQLVIAGRGELRLMKNTDEWEILWKKPFDYEKDRWYTLNLNVTGNTVEATMDGEHLVTYVDEDADFRKIPCGGIGLVMHHCEMRVSEIAVQGEESAIPVMGVFVYKQSVTLPLGSKRKLSAVAYPGEASDRTILWESSDPEVARVDCDGWVFALKEGRTGMIRQREQRNVPCTPFRRREIESGSARRERICLRAGSPSICEREPIA